MTGKAVISLTTGLEDPEKNVAGRHRAPSLGGARCTGA